VTNYHEIFRQASLGLSKTDIGRQLGCSRNTISVILSRAHKQNIVWPLPENLSDRNIEEALFPERATQSRYKMPDYAKIHHDMGKPGVTFTLLWDEYCSLCRQNGETPMPIPNSVIITTNMCKRPNIVNGHFTDPLYIFFLF
jgi:hypothetical protein